MKVYNLRNGSWFGSESSDGDLDLADTLRHAWSWEQWRIRRDAARMMIEAAKLPRVNDMVDSIALSVPEIVVTEIDDAISRRTLYTCGDWAGYL